MPPKRPADSIQEPASKRSASASNAVVDGPAGYQFQFKLKRDPEYSGDLMVVTGVAKYGGSQAGKLEGKLVRRPSRHEFMSVCDECQELTDMAQAFCHADGSVRLDIEGLQHESAQGKASSGGFVLIEMVELPEQHRRKDVGISFVEALLQWLAGKWSLCVLQSAPASDPYEDPPGFLEMRMRTGCKFPPHIVAAHRAAEERNEKKRQLASQKIATQFYRLGFRQRQRGSDLFYLVPESLTKQSRNVAQPPTLAEKVVRQPLSEVDAALVELVSESEPGIKGSSPLGKLLFERDAKELFARGACVNRSNALHFAAANGKDVALATLTQRFGGDVNKKDAGGTTPLHIAASVPACRINTIVLLLELGASITDVDPEGRRPAKMLLDSLHSLSGFRASFQLAARPMDMDSDRDKIDALWLLLTPQERVALQNSGLSKQTSLPLLMPQVEKLLFQAAASSHAAQRV